MSSKSRARGKKTLGSSSTKSSAYVFQILPLCIGLHQFESSVLTHPFHLHAQVPKNAIFLINSKKNKIPVFPDAK